MEAAIHRIDEDREYFTAERCHINELWNTDRDGDVSIARARVEPGVTTAWHRLVGTVERYVIVDGVGEVEIGTLPPQRLAAGDVAVIPALCRQRITNVGTTDLVFLAICSPRFRERNYEEIADPDGAGS